MPSASEIRAGKAYIEMTTKDKTAGGLKAMEAKLRRLGSSIVSITKKVAAVGIAGVAGALAAAKGFSDAGDKIAKMSRRTGLSTEALSELGFAAEQSGTDIDTLETAIRKSQKVLAGADEESKKAQASLAKLGISVEDLAGLDPEQQFTALLDALGQMPDPAKRTAAALEVFGKSGAALIPMASEGAAGIKELRDEAKSLGVTISGADAMKAEALNDAFGRMTRASKALVFGIGGSLAPEFRELSDTIAEAAASAGNFLGRFNGLGGAMKAVWLELQVLAAEAFDSIDAKTGGFVTKLQHAFDNIADYAKIAWMNLKIGFTSIFEDIAFFFTDKLPAILENLWNMMKAGADVAGISISGTFERAWIRVKNGLDEAAAQQELLAQQQAQDAATAAVTRKAVAVPQRQQTPAELAMIQERDALRNKVGAELGGKLAGDRTGEIANLREQQRLLLQQAEEAKAISDAKAEMDFKGRNAATPEEVVAKDKAKREAVGTFSAYAAAQIGSGVAERTAKATEQTARNTEKLLQKVSAGALVFA